MNTSLLAKWIILGALSQSPSAPTPGSVVETGQPCPRGNGGIPNTSCRVLEINGPGLKPIAVEVRVTEASTGAAYRGTVVIGSGGDGAGFYAGQEGGKILAADLAAMGFRVVDRAWVGGWIGGGAGLRIESQRYATLLTWIHDHIHKGGYFVATGNSGGSAEIGYALTTWGRGEILDVAIPTSGPPVARLDYACVKQASPDWASMCAAIVPKGSMECGVSACILGPANGSVCHQAGANPTPEQLFEDSVVHPGAVLSYPKTKVYFLYGAQDCGEPVPIGLTYATKVTSEKSIQFVPKTPHALFSTAEGRDAIKRAIDDGTGFKQGAKQVAQTAPLSVETIKHKVQNGEPLTAAERQFVQAGRGPATANNQQQAMEERRKQYIAQHPPQASVGLIPLTDLGAGTYQGEQGGLYPGGSNVPPKAHVDAGLQQARLVVPRDKDGKPSADGKIVFLSIGFSNPNMEFPTFIRRAHREADLNPSMLMVNGCVGSRASSEQADPQSRYWEEVSQRLSAAGVTAQQVQALWIKEVIPGAEGFPGKAKELTANIEATLRVVHNRFPNSRLAYLSSRTYGGWTELGGSPEPGAYETGFAVKWAVSDQLAAKPELNYDPAKGAVVAPWVEWGPYFWTDGVKGRKDGMVYLREDVQADGLHPSPKGQAKVAELLLKFFREDPTARAWFLK